MPTVPPAARIKSAQNTQSAVSSPVFTVFTLEELLFTEGLFPEEDDAAVDVTDGDGVTDLPLSLCGCRRGSPHFLPLGHRQETARSPRRFFARSSGG